MTKKTKWSVAELDRRYAEIAGDPADDSPSAKKRRRILRAAHALFLQQGYRKTSIDDVARKAEVAKGTVYLYFENKGQLLVHAIGLEKLRLRERVLPLFDGSLPKEDGLELWIEIAITAAKELPLTARLLSGDAELFSALEDVGAEEVAARTAEGTEFIVELIERAAPGKLTDAEKRARADTLLAIAWTAGHLADDRVRGSLSVEELAKTLASMLVHGVGGPPRKRR